MEKILNLVKRLSYVLIAMVFVLAIVFIVLRSNPVALTEKPAEIVGDELTADNIVNVVNWERYKAGLPLLQRSEILERVANAKLQDMLEYCYWEHTNPITGVEFDYWFEQEGYSSIGSPIGENLGRYFKTTSQAVEGWLNSPSHRAAMLNSDYSETGVAVSQTACPQKGISIEGIWIVQEFGGAPK